MRDEILGDRSFFMGHCLSFVFSFYLYKLRYIQAEENQEEKHIFCETFWDKNLKLSDRRIILPEKQGDVHYVR